MTFPAFLFGTLLALLYGAVFHLWKDGGPFHLLADLALGWVGFWGGHLLAAFLGWRWDLVGVLHFWVGTAAAVVFLLVGHFLSQPPQSSH